MCYSSVVYCGRECQLASWKEHKHLCAAWTTVKARPITSPPPALFTSYPPPDANAVNAIHQYMWKTLYRPLHDELDKNPKLAGSGVNSTHLANCEPRCCCCYGLEGPERKLKACKECLLFAWCEEGECERRCRTQHVREGLCAMLKRSNVEESFILGHERDSTNEDRVVRWAPGRIHDTLNPLPTTWPAYFVANPCPVDPAHPVVPSMFKFALNIPLTILSAMERFGLTTKFGDKNNRKPLTIHLAGATIYYELEVAGELYEEVCGKHLCFGLAC